MKNRLRALFCAAGLLWAGGATAQTALPNAGFETWQSRPLNNERPEGWLTADDILYQLLSSPLPLTPNATRLVTKSSDKYTGSSATQLAPKNITVLGSTRPLPSILLLGSKFRVSVQEILTNPESLADINRLRGIAYTARPAQLTFWYKFAGTSTDQAQVALALSKGNLNTNSGFIVGTASSTASNVITPGTTTYRQFSVPITYISTEAPDSLRLGFSVGGNQVFSSTAALTIDDVVLSTTTANANPAVATSLSVYPNPSTNGLFSMASLQKPSVATAPLSVTDALGKVVLQQAAAPISAADGRQLDLRGKPAGVYLLHLDTPEGVVVRKLQLQ